jgi:hypothetical protein
MICFLTDYADFTEKGAARVEQPFSNSTKAYQKIFGTSQVKAT